MTSTRTGTWLCKWKRSNGALPIRLPVLDTRTDKNLHNPLALRTATLVVPAFLTCLLLQIEQLLTMEALPSATPDTLTALQTRLGVPARRAEVSKGVYLECVHVCSDVLVFLACCRLMGTEADCMLAGAVVRAWCEQLVAWPSNTLQYSWLRQECFRGRPQSARN